MYDLRIKWLRAELRSLIELQIKDKAALRTPHDDLDNASWLQCTSLSRSYKITALLILLNDERNKVRAPERQREHSHSIQDKWARSQVKYECEKQLKRLDEAHPYPRLYVVVDSSLSPIQKGIQGSHAIAELFKRYGVLDHSGLVFLEVDRDEMWRLSAALRKDKWRTATYCDPFWGNRITAIAVEPKEWAPDDDTPTCLQDLPLAGKEPAKPQEATKPQPLQKLMGLLR